MSLHVSWTFVYVFLTLVFYRSSISCLIVQNKRFLKQKSHLDLLELEMLPHGVDREKLDVKLVAIFERSICNRGRTECCSDKCVGQERFSD